MRPGSDQPNSRGQSDKAEQSKIARPYLSRFRRNNHCFPAAKFLSPFPRWPSAAAFWILKSPGCAANGGRSLAAGFLPRLLQANNPMINTTRTIATGMAQAGAGLPRESPAICVHPPFISCSRTTNYYLGRTCMVFPRVHCCSGMARHL